MQSGGRQRLKGGEKPSFTGFWTVQTAVTETAEGLQMLEAVWHAVTVVAGRALPSLAPHRAVFFSDAKMFVAEMMNGDPGQLEGFAAVGAAPLLLPHLLADVRMTQYAPGKISPMAVCAMTFSGLSQRSRSFEGHGGGQGRQGRGWQRSRPSLAFEPHLLQTAVGLAERRSISSISPFWRSLHMCMS